MKSGKEQPYSSDLLFSLFLLLAAVNFFKNHGPNKGVSTTENA